VVDRLIIVNFEEFFAVFEKYAGSLDAFQVLTSISFGGKFKRKLGYVKLKIDFKVRSS
jgi:hypothetical protein